MIVALGSFDGFHKAHQQLLDTAKKRALSLGVDWGIVTFDGHPQSLFTGNAFRLLFTEEERLLLSRYWQIPHVCKIPFTRDLADMLPEKFIDYLRNKVNVQGIVVGEDFRFGRARMGTLELLSQVCRENGWTLDIVPLLYLDGIAVSSSEIRNRVRSASPKCAWNLLGHPFFYHGVVIGGDRRGRTMGFPTANLSLQPEKIRPGKGVYATLTAVEGNWHIGAANVGHNPTFGNQSGFRFEIHLCDYSGDLYGNQIHVFLLDYLRDEVLFANTAALTTQMQKDVCQTKKIGRESLVRDAEIWNRFGALLFSP